MYRAEIARWSSSEYDTSVMLINHLPPKKASLGLMQVVTGCTPAFAEVLENMAIGKIEGMEFMKDFFFANGGADIADVMEETGITYENANGSMLAVNYVITIEGVDIEMATVACLEQRQSAPVGLTTFVAYMMQDEVDDFISERNTNSLPAFDLSDNSDKYLRFKNQEVM